MRIALFIGCFIALYVLYAQSFYLKPEPPNQLLFSAEEVLPAFPEEDSLLLPDSVVAVQLGYDTMALHHLLEKMIKTYKDSIPDSFALEFWKVVDTAQYSHLLKFIDYYKPAKLEHFYSLANMDEDPNKELLLHIDDIDASFFLFKKDSIWRLKDQFKYLSLAMMGMANRGGHAEIDTTFKQIPVFTTVNYGYPVGEYEIGLYLVRNDSFVKALTLMEGFLGFPPFHYSLYYDVSRINKNQIKVNYHPVIKDYNTDTNVDLGPIKVIYGYNPQTYYFDQVTKLDSLRQKVLICKEIGDVMEGKDYVLKAFRQEIDQIRKNGKKAERKALNNIIHEIDSLDQLYKER